MSFQEAIQTVFGKYATFQGRARRSEYWYFMLFVFCVNLVIRMLMAFVGDNETLAFVLAGIAMIFSLGTLVPQVAVAVRRLHDIGRSGWFYLIGAIPFIGWILLLVWFCTDSQPGDNQYGPNPKDAGYNNTVY